MFNIFDQNLMIQRMRDELTEHGFSELRTAEEVEAALRGAGGSTLLMINSVCGCAAGAARPGVVQSLQGETRPERLVTVFAGQDREATERARIYLPGLPPSSPSVALIKDGAVAFMLPRQEIEGRTAEQIATVLRTAYTQYL